MIDKLKLLQESELEALFYEQLEGAGLHEDVEWHRIIGHHETDFCWYDLRIIVEIQGGTAGFGKSRGSHVREPGYSNDRMFSNLRQIEGWWVLEFTAKQVRDEEALYITKIALKHKREENAQ
jgi:very-short-patch-repair endonuclease